MNPELEEAIISVAYGDAGPLKRWKVQRLAKTDADVARALDQHRSAAQVGSFLAQTRCPEHVCERVHDAVRPRRSRSRALWNPYPLLVPIAAMAIAAMFFIDRPGSTPTPASTGGYSEAEIQQAQRDLVMSGEIISYALQKASNQSAQLISREVAQPVQQAYTNTKQILIGTKS